MLPAAMMPAPAYIQNLAKPELQGQWIYIWLDRILPVQIHPRRSLAVPRRPSSEDAGRIRTMGMARECGPVRSLPCSSDLGATLDHYQPHRLQPARPAIPERMARGSYPWIRSYRLARGGQHDRIRTGLGIGPDRAPRTSLAAIDPDLASSQFPTRSIRIRIRVMLDAGIRGAWPACYCSCPGSLWASRQNTSGHLC